MSNPEPPHRVFLPPIWVLRPTPTSNQLPPAIPQPNSLSHQQALPSRQDQVTVDPRKQPRFTATQLLRRIEPNERVESSNTAAPAIPLTSTSNSSQPLIEASTSEDRSSITFPTSTVIGDKHRFTSPSHSSTQFRSVYQTPPTRAQSPSPQEDSFDRPSPPKQRRPRKLPRTSNVEPRHSPPEIISPNESRLVNKKPEEVNRDTEQAQTVSPSTVELVERRSRKKPKIDLPSIPKPSTSKPFALNSSTSSSFCSTAENIAQSSKGKEKKKSSSSDRNEATRRFPTEMPQPKPPQPTASTSSSARQIRKPSPEPIVPSKVVKPARPFRAKKTKDPDRPKNAERDLSFTHFSYVKNCFVSDKIWIYNLQEYGNEEFRNSQIDRIEEEGGKVVGDMDEAEIAVLSGWYEDGYNELYREAVNNKLRIVQTNWITDCLESEWVGFRADPYDEEYDAAVPKPHKRIRIDENGKEFEIPRYTLKRPEEEYFEKMMNEKKLKKLEDGTRRKYTEKEMWREAERKFNGKFHHWKEDYKKHWPEFLRLVEERELNRLPAKKRERERKRRWGEEVSTSEEEDSEESEEEDGREEESMNEESKRNKKVVKKKK